MLFEILRAVWESFRANRGRFILTLLGVVIGSASLVLLSGLLEGGKEALMSASQQAAEDDLIEMKSREPKLKDERRTTRNLGQGDVELLGSSALLGDATVVPQRQRWETVYWQGKKKQSVLVGALPDAMEIYRLSLTAGRFLTDGDVAERRRVAVVGYKIWKELFDEAPLSRGLEIKTNQERFAVVGVLAHKPSFGGDGPWQWDSRVMLPQSVFNVVLPPMTGGPRDVDRIFLRLGQVRALADRIGEVRAIAKGTVLRRHLGVENFRIAGEKEGDAKGELIMMIISLLILATAVISLIVGGINVMNIMLVSVSERTREIGIRRAVGAPRGYVLLQFLAESVLTSGLGGLIGVGSGIGLTVVATRILDKVVGGWTFHIVAWAPPLALGAALAVGALFGWFPAWKAARLDPVEALRFE